MDTLSDAAAIEEASRCLQCDLVCNICTTVCPNRSNMYYPMEPVTLPVETAVNNNGEVEILREGSVNINQPYQVLNIGDYCNECGNCTLFCPSAGDPYKDKPKFHLRRESFANAEFGFHFSAATMQIKGNKGVSVLEEKNGNYHYQDSQLEVVLNGSSLAAEEVTFKDPECLRMGLGFIAEYVLLYKSVRPNLPVIE